MTIGYPKDGVLSDNVLTRRTQPIINVQDLKNSYLFGIDIVDNNGTPLPDATYQGFIDSAISWLEHHLDILVTPVTFTEEKDYFANDYYEWGFFFLNNVPVLNVTNIAVVYLQQPDPNNPNLEVAEQVLQLPKEWYRLREHDGILRLVPNNHFPANLQISAGGTFFPELFARQSNVPQLWRITYQAGFDNGKVPAIINQAIGLLAAIYALNVAGDLVFGAGVAAESISIDGMSQALTTTASAENHTFSAKVRAFNSVLFGDSINSPNRGIIRILMDYYQGQRLTII